MAYNSSYIYNEQAQWLVNWVNVTFVVAHNISSIESIRIWYVDYTNFTFSWNTIVLGDAPSVINWWIYVDYFYDTSIQTFDNINLIYDEKTIWEADGTNVVFYSVYPIGRVDELRVGWVAYTSFTINGRAITLASAPSEVLGAPRLDYYRKDVDVNLIDSWVTLTTLRSSIYSRIWQTVTSLQFPKSLVDEYIQEWIIRISKMKKDRVKRWVFSFRKAWDTTITSTDWNIITVGATSDYLPSKWIAIVDFWNVVYYNWKTDSTITSISWLEIDTIGWSKIQYWYKLSQTIEKVAEVYIDWFKLTPCDFAEYNNAKNNDNFCIYNGYLFLPYRKADGDVVKVVYNWKYTTTYEDTDIIDFDWEYISVIKSFVLYNMYKDREDDRFNLETQNYKQLLREYKRELSKQYETTSTVMQTAWPLNRW